MKVSVLILAYKVEEFIGQALESVLDQRVDFDYEIVIGEDCSPDGTYAILQEYQRHYPDRIRVLRTERNVGGNHNLVRTLRECHGEYVALLDGDDYWTSPDKLRLQVEFMDAHPGYSICFHNVEEFDEDGSRPPRLRLPDSQPERTTLADLLTEGDFIPTASAMLRNGLVHRFPEWYYDLPFGDWSLFILHAQHGDIGYISKVMAARRCHSGGVWTSRQPERFWLGALRMYSCLDELSGGRYRRIMRAPISRHYHLLALDYERKGDLPLARSYALCRLRTLPFDRSGELPLVHLARLYTPGVYSLARSFRRILSAHPSN